MRLPVIISLFVPILAFSQNQVSEIPGFHKHDGFFLSMNIGPGFGDINLDASGTFYKKMVTSGSGIDVDFQIGGAVSENLILSAALTGRTVESPTMEFDGTKMASSSDFKASDNLIGLGITYYIMPYNIFLNGSVGTGNFVLETRTSSFTSEYGFGFNLKAGKEWWVGNNWGLGVSAGMGYLSAKDKGDPNTPTYSGEMSTGKFFILFNTTYN